MTDRIYYLSFGIALTLMVLSCNSSAPDKQNTEMKRGQANYESYCIACHGPDGKQGLMGAKDLSISTMNKTEAIEIITNGKSTMTPFRNVMNDEEIAEVADYVQSLKN